MKGDIRCFLVVSLNLTMYICCLPKSHRGNIIFEKMNISKYSQKTKIIYEKINDSCQIKLKIFCKNIKI